MLPYTSLNTDNGIEITSVDEFMREISELKKKQDVKDSYLFFRGQEADFWNVEPSIFRDDLLSIEHILMSEPLRQIPKEFRGLDNPFEIMEKYQHYGMCTRLLDVTTNSLVALYFACLPHSKVKYYDLDNGEYYREPYGVVYYKEERSPILYNSFQTNLISMLSRYDMRDGMEIKLVMDKLFEDGIISKEQKDKWCNNSGIGEFIKMVQAVYTVLPILSNDRLVRQSGAFLLPGKFNFSISTDVESGGYMYKSVSNLLDEFETVFFYIPPERKEGILEELEICNISDASLFPELEYKLKYIRRMNESKKKIVAYYEKFHQYNNEYNDMLEGNIQFNRELANKALEAEVYSKKKINPLLEIVEKYVCVDWMKRDSVLSKIKMEVCKFLMDEGEEKQYAYREASRILDVIINVHADAQKNRSDVINTNYV